MPTTGVHLAIAEKVEDVGGSDGEDFGLYEQDIGDAV